MPWHQVAPHYIPDGAQQLTVMRWYEPGAYSDYIRTWGRAAQLHEAAVLERIADDAAFVGVVALEGEADRPVDTTHPVGSAWATHLNQVGTRRERWAARLLDARPLLPEVSVGRYELDRPQTMYGTQLAMLGSLLRPFARADDLTRLAECPPQPVSLHLPYDTVKPWMVPEELPGFRDSSDVVRGDGSYVRVHRSAQLGHQPHVPRGIQRYDATIAGVLGAIDEGFTMQPHFTLLDQDPAQ